MRRSDRALAVMARRTTWILRGIARLAPAGGRSSIRAAGIWSGAASAAPSPTGRRSQRSAVCFTGRRAPAP